MIRDFSAGFGRGSKLASLITSRGPRIMMYDDDGRSVREVEVVVGWWFYSEL